MAGGKHFLHKGSGTNHLCLPRNPKFQLYGHHQHRIPARPTVSGYVYGAEYTSWFGSHYKYNIPCSVCRAPQSTTIMLPATPVCPQGWTTQYTGHLTAQYKDHYATEYVCLDGSPDNYDDSSEKDQQHLFYYVLARCGSLPCSTYRDDRAVTCGVCSK